MSQIAAIAARTRENAEGFAKDFGLSSAKTYEGYEALAKDDSIDVVYIGTINPTHLPLVKLMVNHGKNVLCEKSLGMNVRETKEMIQLAKDKRVFLMEAVWSRCHPAYALLKDELKIIGKVVCANIEFGFNLPPHFAPNVFEKKLGGGGTLNMGIYAIQMAQLIFGGEKPKEILAGGHLNEDGVDVAVSGALFYADGRMASFQQTNLVGTSCEASIYGTEGQIKVGYPLWCPNKLIRKDGQEVAFPLKVGKFKYNLINSAGLFYEAQHVRQCLLKGLTESPLLPLDETLMLAEIMESVRKQVGVEYDQDKC